MAAAHIEAALMLLERSGPRERVTRELAAAVAEIERWQRMAAEWAEYPYAREEGA
jgi:hypothetical protein